MNNTCNTRAALVGGFIVFALTATVHADAVLYVDDSAAPGGDGVRWDTAYRFLQDALAVATDGTEIRVAQGTYRPDRAVWTPEGTGDREATFNLMSGVALRGGYGGVGAADPDQRAVKVFETTLSGDLAGNDGPRFFENIEENSYHVVTGSDTDATAVLDGFTISGGNTNNYPDDRGAGMLNEAGSPLITSCTFTGNIASTGGGGLYNNDGSSPAVLDCTFVSNRAPFGAGMFNLGSSPEVTRCFFALNIATRNGTGGGMYNGSRSRPRVMNSTFVANHAKTGAAIANKSASVTLINSTILANSAKTEIISNDHSTTWSRISNCIVYYNFSNNGEIIEQTRTRVEFSDVQYGWEGAGEGNIDTDPLLVDLDGPDDDRYTLEDNDYRLAPGSPCIDVGDNDALPDGVTTDFDGNPRLVDDPSAKDSGECVVVDMGAYEYQKGNTECCDSDLDGSGAVDFGDVLLVLAAWGPCSGCPEDLDQSGSVDFGDVLIVLTAWGPCP